MKLDKVKRFLIDCIPNRTVRSQAIQYINNMIDRLSLFDDVSIIHDEIESNDSVYLEITDENIVHGIVGEINMSEILNIMDHYDKDLINYEYPAGHINGNLSFDLSQILRSCHSIDEIHYISDFCLYICRYFENDSRFIDEKAEKEYESWSYTEIDKETQAIIYNYRLENNEENYDSIYDWLENNAEDEDFNLSYDRDILEKFIKRKLSRNVERFNWSNVKELYRI